MASSYILRKIHLDSLAMHGCFSHRNTLCHNHYYFFFFWTFNKMTCDFAWLGFRITLNIDYFFHPSVSLSLSVCERDCLLDNQSLELFVFICEWSLAQAINVRMPVDVIRFVFYQLSHGAVDGKIIECALPAAIYYIGKYFKCINYLIDWKCFANSKERRRRKSHTWEKRQRNRSISGNHLKYIYIRTTAAVAATAASAHHDKKCDTKAKEKQ